MSEHALALAIPRLICSCGWETNMHEGFTAGDMDDAAKAHTGYSGEAILMLWAENGDGCYICQPDNPKAAEEGCDDCDRASDAYHAALSPTPEDKP